MLLSLEMFEPFVPKWNGNESEDKPIKIHYKNPSMPLYEKLIPRPELLVKISPDGISQGGESKMVIDNKAIVLEMVEKIENLEVPTAAGTVRQITKPNQLYEDGVPSYVSGLVDEIGSYLQGILSKKAGVSAKN
jgi:hypothetical protein